MRPLTAALLIAVSPAWAADTGLAGVLDGAHEGHSSLVRRNAAMLDQGKLCRDLVQAGKLPPNPMAQYRCILAGARSTPDTAPQATAAAAPTSGIGPRAPAP